MREAGGQVAVGFGAPQFIHHEGGQPPVASYTLAFPARSDRGREEALEQQPGQILRVGHAQIDDVHVAEILR